MAAFSFSFLVRARTVWRTRLIHRHSVAASVLDVFLACGILSVRDIFMEMVCLWSTRLRLHERGVWVCEACAVPPRDIFYVLLEIMEINRLTHSRDDLCGIQSYYSQSVGPGRYTTTNLNPKATGVNPIASDQLLMYPREGFGFNNAAIDADSVLRNQMGFTNHRCQIRPQSRPFLTVPFMAGGSPSRDVESLLLHSEQVRMGKECGTVSEQFFSQQYTPMIPILKENIQNPKNIISEVAAPGWIHGGIPSRSYLRDVNC
jgi:hypothetical protein